MGAGTEVRNLSVQLCLVPAIGTWKPPPVLNIAFPMPLAHAEPLFIPGVLGNLPHQMKQVPPFSREGS